MSGRASLGAALEALVAELVDQRVAERLAGLEVDPWVDQHASPLGRALHCRLVRTGEIDGRKIGRRVLVRRSEIDRYIEARGEATAPAAMPANDQIDATLAALGFDATRAVRGSR